MCVINYSYEDCRIDSSENCRIKALKLLISEFANEKYADFVKEELSRLEACEKDKIGFQSEGDDVYFDLSLDGCFIEYEYWDSSLNDFVKGKGELSYEFVVKEIKAVIGSYE